MAARVTALKDHLGALLCTVLINDSNPTEIVQIEDVKTEDVIVTEEPEIIESKTSSVGVQRRKTVGYTVTVEFTLTENETDLIAAVRALASGEGELIMTTAEGGDNGTGKTFTVTAADIDAVYVEGHGTKFTLVKYVPRDTLAYTVSHVAA